MPSALKQMAFIITNIKKPKSAYSQNTSFQPITTYNAGSILIMLPKESANAITNQNSASWYIHLTEHPNVINNRHIISIGCN